MEPLLVKKHEKYFRMCLMSLPAKAQSEDSNKLAIIYFCVHGLDLLGKLNFTPTEQEQYSEFIYDHIINETIGNEEIQAFRPSQTFKLNKIDGTSSSPSYDLPNLAATFFGLITLLALNSNYGENDKIDRHKIMKFVSMLQLKDGPNKGGFKPVLGVDRTPFGECDLRHCYTALCIRKLLKYDELSKDDRKYDIDIDSIQKFLSDRISVNGGLSSNKYTEPHSGLTFCGIAALKLSGYDFKGNQSNWVDQTINWLVHRQVDYPSLVESYATEDYYYWDSNDIGGFNGRENKFGDTCYSWWCTASLKILCGNQGLQLIDSNAAQKYLLDNTQNKLIGGFGKDGETFPDPLHSFLALASLSMWKNSINSSFEVDGNSELGNIDELLVISSGLKDFLDKVIYI